ncbi:unnamed protein product [Ixodes hexagonus]
MFTDVPVVDVIAYDLCQSRAAPRRRVIALSSLAGYLRMCVSLLLCRPTSALGEVVSFGSGLGQAVVVFQQ